MGQHAKLMSPSKFDRWTVCHGAPTLEADAPRRSSDAADSGTAKHFLGATCLETDTHPSTFIGRKIAVGTVGDDWDGAVWDNERPEGFVERRVYEVDMDFAAAVNAYFQGVKRLTAGASLEIEVRVPLKPLTGEDAEGSADAIAVVAYEDNDGFGTELQVHDLKSGYGIVPADCGQLKMYAAAYVLDRKLEVQRIRLVIHQPARFNEPDEYVMPIAELEEFIASLAPHVDTVTLAYKHRANWVGKEDSYLTPGEHCTFCAAAATCPKLVKLVAETVGQDLEHFADETKTTVEALPELCSNEDLAVRLAACDNIESWISAVRAEAERRLLEAGNSEDARRSLGCKLVQGRKGARQWSDERAAEETLKSMRLKQEEMYHFKVISPTDAEKLFGDKGSQPSTKRWNKLQAMIVQKDGKIHVAPLDDPRAPVVLDKAAGFDDETGGDLV